MEKFDRSPVAGCGWRSESPAASLAHSIAKNAIEWGTQCLYWPPVIFQEVVHSIRTREADCDEQSSFRGQTEWTSTRMPDSLFAVQRRWSKPSFAAWASAVPQPAFA